MRKRQTSLAVGARQGMIFEYIDQSVLEGRRKHGEVSSMRRYRFLSGEGLSFGIEEGTVEAFLKACGFHQVRDVNAEDLKRMYLHGENANRRIPSGYGIT